MCRTYVSLTWRAQRGKNFTYGVRADPETARAHTPARVEPRKEVRATTTLQAFTD